MEIDFASANSQIDFVFLDSGTGGIRRSASAELTEFASANSRIDFAFLDSGTGGVPYLLHLQKKSPESKCVYLADSANFPYGTKSCEEIISCATEACAKIIHNFSPRAIVIACNTISVTALSALREKMPDVPIVGTVPAIKLAATVTRNKKIGLLATSATVQNDYIENLERDFASDCDIICRGDDDLVSFIEHKFFDATEKEKCDAVSPAIEFFRKKNCDTIVLGCTHFLHLSDVFATVAGSDIQIVDSREGVANQALRVINNEQCGMSNAELAMNGEQLSIINSQLSTVYVSGFTKDSDKSEYNLLCKRLGLKFGGLLEHGNRTKM